MPHDISIVTNKLASMQHGKIIDEEKELASRVNGRIYVGDRRQSSLGKPKMFDSSFIKSEKFGFDDVFMHNVMIGLGKIRTSEPISRDKNLIQAIRNLDDQIGTINLYNERLHEWYGMHFPELADYVKDDVYADLISKYGQRDTIIKKLGLDIQSIGSDFDLYDMHAVMSLASMLCYLYEYKSNIEKYI